MRSAAPIQTDERSLDQSLRRFRTTHQVVRRQLVGASWSYFDCGHGAATLLLLPGAPGLAEMAFPYLLAFKPRYRMLAPSYPPSVGRLDQLLDGLIALLQAETDQPVHLIGDTGVPQLARAYRHHLLLAAIERLPRLGLHAVLLALRGTTAHHRFWQRYLRAVVATITLPEIANRLGIMIEMDQRGQRLGTGSGWRGPTLLIETADDPLFAPAERAALRKRFPQAELHRFYNQGHTTALTRFDEYIGLMQVFLARQ